MKYQGHCPTNDLREMEHQRITLCDFIRILLIVILGVVISSVIIVIAIYVSLATQFSDSTVIFSLSMAVYGLTLPIYVF